MILPLLQCGYTIVRFAQDADGGLSYASKRCENEARYVNEKGWLCCATCPVQHGHDSVRLADISRLLAFARAIAEPGGYADDLPVSALRSAAREIIGKRPDPVAPGTPEYIRISAR